MTKTTLKTLGDSLKHTEEKLGRAEAERDRERTNRIGLETKIKEVTQQFDDLKSRLHAAETSNQFMRGYLARVQEDDTVREELIAIGDPLGEQQLVPKRKRTEFPSPNQYTDFNAGGDRFYGNKTNNKHWVTY